jgi:hypothetical protein
MLEASPLQTHGGDRNAYVGRSQPIIAVYALMAQERAPLSLRADVTALPPGESRYVLNA